MANFFRNKIIKDIGKVEIPVLSTASNARATIIGMALTNLTENTVTASVLMQDDTSVKGYYIKDMMLMPNTTLKVLNGGEKIILAPDNTIGVIASHDDCLDLVLSYVEIV